MKLTNIYYEMYSSDYESIDLSSNSHELDREVRLDFDETESIYISWTKEPEQFCIGYKNSSWFENEPEKTQLVSNLKIFSSIINKECEIEYLNKKKQILKVSSISGAIYFSSKEGNKWFSDVINISNTEPNFDS